MLKRSWEAIGYAYEMESKRRSLSKQKHTYNDVSLLADPSVRMGTGEEGQELGILVDHGSLDYDSIGSLASVLN